MSLEVSYTQAADAGQDVQLSISHRFHLLQELDEP